MKALSFRMIIGLILAKFNTVLLLNENHKKSIE